MNKTEHYISKLALEKHPEGGWFKEVYSSNELIKAEHLPARFKGHRRHSTSIYFLLTGDTFSALHRIKSDELWHFYDGSPVSIHMIDEKGNYSAARLGHDVEEGEVFQFAVPAGVWFGATINDKDSFTLVGCTVAPGFHFDDFELGVRGELVKSFPQHKGVIEKLTRG
ncbi:MAG: cupin domain-containing protein [Ignavibacteria bacterium]|nr:cupin domain-containing protein [Ignavibacteria bacterium]